MTELTRRKALAGLAGLSAAAAGLTLGVGCSAVAGPQRVPLLGYLGVGPVQAVWAGFREGMKEFGWIEGQTYHVDMGLSPNRADLPELAVKQARRPVDLVVAYGSPAPQAALQATRTIPIVMFGVLSDPIELGWVASLARPGGNLTGTVALGPQMSAKRLELLQAIVPGCTRVGVLLTPDNGSRTFLIRETESAAQHLGLEVRLLDADSPPEIVAAYEAAQRWPADAMVVLPDARLATMYPTVIDEAARTRIPSLYGTAIAATVASGALMGFGPSTIEMYRRPAYFVDRILRGASPGELPIEHPTTFEFVVNTRTLQALGLTLPPHVAAQVTDWVE